MRWMRPRGGPSAVPIPGRGRIVLAGALIRGEASEEAAAHVATTLAAVSPRPSR